MERKIGEVFEYNNEWYQCIDELSCGVHCNGCDFRGRGNCELDRCRNAWWKILNWKPDWEGNECVYSINYYRGKILKSTSIGTNHILAFPTEETIDKFLETFKDLIEEAKELL